MSEKPLTLEVLTGIYEKLARLPITRVVVSRLAEPDTLVELPRYYDRKRCGYVKTFVMGGEVWKRLLAEFPTTPDSAFPAPLHGVPVEFSPPSWRP